MDTQQQNHRPKLIVGIMLVVLLVGAVAVAIWSEHQRTHNAQCQVLQNFLNNPSEGFRPGDFDVFGKAVTNELLCRDIAPTLAKQDELVQAAVISYSQTNKDGMALGLLAVIRRQSSGKRFPTLIDSVVTAVHNDEAEIQWAVNVLEAAEPNSVLQQLNLKEIFHESKNGQLLIALALNCRVNGNIEAARPHILHAADRDDLDDVTKSALKKYAGPK